MGNTHRAWRYAAYGPIEQVLQLQSLPRPEPAAGEVLVQVRHVSINPLDWKLVEGHYRWFLKSKPPCGVGTEFSGVVAATGAGVSGLAPGQAVLAGLRPNREPPGALAEFVTMPQAHVVPLPPDVDPLTACTLPVAGVSALQMCRMAQVQRGTRVLVHGAAGGVGHACVLWALQLGAVVHATGGPASQSFLSALGVQRAFDYTRDAPAAWGGPFDAVLDCVARLGARELALLMPAGGHAVATLPRVPGVAFDPLLNPLRARKRHTLMLDVRRDDLELLLTQLAAGRFVPRVTQRHAMADAVQALLDSRSGHARGKLVVDVSAGG